MIGLAILFYIVVLFVIAPTIVLTMTRRLYWPKWQMHSASASNAPLPVRSVEAAMVAGLSALVFLFWMTDPGVYGCIYHFKLMRPEVASVHMIFVISMGALLLVSAAAAWWWRTWLGVTGATITLLSYMYLLSGLGPPLEQRFGVGMTPPSTVCTIELQDDIEGAELWVNGVYLGKTPVTMTHKEFALKVPPKWQPPKDDRGFGLIIDVPDCNVRGSGVSMLRRWTRFSMFGAMKMQWQNGMWRPNHSSQKNKDYFAALRLNGDWGGGGSSGGSGGGIGRRYTWTSTLSVQFPERNRRIERLLDQARARDYAVSDAWFSKMSKFGLQGRKALRAVIQREPEFGRVMADWATLQFDLNRVTNADSAWDAFMRICDEANRVDRYSLSDVEGCALEAIIEYLDEQRLVDYALKRIGASRYVSQSYGWEGEGNGFVGRVLSATKTSGTMYMPASDYAVAHAVWLLDKRLDEQHKAGHENIVERRVAPALIRMDPRQQGVKLAVQLGGPVVTDYLMRHDWRATLEGHDFKNGERVNGKTVNRWLYLLGHLREPEAERWRSKRDHEFMAMADRAIEGLFTNIEEVSFLFVAGPRVTKSLARSYWPRFMQKVGGERGENLREIFEYLVKMEDDATAQMYIRAMYAQGRSSRFLEVIHLLRKLPRQKQISVLRAMREETIKNGDRLAALLNEDAKQFRENTVRELNAELLVAGDVEAIEQKVEALELNDQSIRKVTAQWLVEDHADHALVARLAEHDDAELRLLVMGALREHPSPRNRGLLKKLLVDEDESVRARARGVLEVIEALVGDGGHGH